jgi:translation initiation factor 5
VLTALYENDIVEDDIILAWHNHTGTAKSLGVLPADAEKVRKAAAPFVEWLEEEEDTGTESEDED